MNPGGRVTIKVGGTIWSRFLVAVAVMRVFWLQFVLAILAWMVAGVVLHETPLFAGAVLFRMWIVPKGPLMPCSAACPCHC